MIKIPFGAGQASEETVKYLMEIGAIYADETGIHANEPGIYPKKEEIPTQTANPSGDE